jgi:hypothetical protein
VYSSLTVIDTEYTASIRDTIREITGRPDLRVLILARGVHLGVISG